MLKLNFPLFYFVSFRHKKHQVRVCLGFKYMLYFFIKQPGNLCEISSEVFSGFTLTHVENWSLVKDIQQFDDL